MKIYFLRHEHRNPNDVLFRSELNAEGKALASSLLKNFLNFLDIDEIYCSPFIRAMQTVTPYINEYKPGMKINVDYSIAERINHERFIPKENQVFDLKEIDYLRYPINRDYKSLLDHSVLFYKEEEMELIARLKPFSDFIKQKYNHTNKNILICSHMSTTNIMINCFYDTKRKMESDYEVGRVSTYDEIKKDVIFLN